MLGEDAIMNQAIMNSLETANHDSYEPLSVEERARKSGEPVCLKNIGNTCYFNSLLQTLFRVPTFVFEIMRVKELEKLKTVGELQSETLKRKNHAIDMMLHLQELFTEIIASNQKYVNPGNVLNHCVDERGEPFKIGDQKDLIEFMVNFFERILEVMAIRDGKDLIPDESVCCCDTGLGGRHEGRQSAVHLDEEAVRPAREQHAAGSEPARGPRVAAQVDVRVQRT